MIKKCRYLILFIVLVSFNKVDGNSSFKSRFKISNFKGYGYVFFNDVSIHGFANLIFIPINNKNSNNFRNKIINLKNNKYPIISIEVESRIIDYLQYKSSFKNNKSNILKIEGNYLISNRHRWRRVFIEYKNYLETYRYNQEDGKFKHGKISQNENYFTRWLKLADNTEIIKIKILKNPPKHHSRLPQHHK